MKAAKLQLFITLAAPLGAVAWSGCIATDSPVLDVTQGCAEFRPGGSFDDVDVDVTVRRYMTAAGDFSQAAAGLKTDVLTACANVARDLGAMDTWSSMSDLDAAVSNDGGTGACDVATRLVEERIIAGQRANANIALLVTKGECRYNFQEQAACDAACAADATCTSGSVETRCTPGSLSVVCDAMCVAGASCIGRVDLPANCMGQCESECQGACSGTCISEDGHRTEGNPSCRGRCSSSCNGMCRGVCRVEASAGVSCGAGVRCTGGCSGTFTDPQCVSEFTPPMCSVDASCLASCSARVAAHAVCDPPTVNIFVDLTVAPELQPVVATLETNLPTLISAGEQRGMALQASARQLATTGDELRGRVSDLDGHSLACVGTASLSLAEALGRFDVSVRASARATSTIRVNSF